MIRTKTNDNAFTGLEAAIVLIAFVVVAAVFSYVVLGAGFFTTQKAQEAVYTAVEQGTSNIQVLGQVYGISTTTGEINTIKFSIGLAPGSPTLDLTGMHITWSTPGSAAPVILSQADFTSSTSLSPREQVPISFTVTGVGANTIVNIEIRPSVGATLPFTKTVPAEITKSTILY
jgi:flagellin FlaB